MVTAPEPLDPASLPSPVREVITPESASDILRLTHTHGCNSRRLDPTHAQRLARDMTAGHWDDLIPEVISLCSHGACLQGQHRLEAVVLSQIPRSFLVSRDVPHLSATRMDSGKARPMSLALGVLGVERSKKEVCAAVRMIHLYDTTRTTVPWSAWRSVKYTVSEILEPLQSRYRDLPDFLAQMNTLKNGLHAAPTASLASAYLVSRDSGDAAAAAEFLNGLASGANIDTTDPRWVLRRWFSSPSRPRRGTAISALQMGLILKCWNLWACEETWAIASMKPSERMPAVVPAHGGQTPLASLPRPRSLKATGHGTDKQKPRHSTTVPDSQALLPLMHSAVPI